MNCAPPLPPPFSLEGGIAPVGAFIGAICEAGQGATRWHLVPALLVTGHSEAQQRAWSSPSTALPSQPWRGQPCSLSAHTHLPSVQGLAGTRLSSAPPWHTHRWGLTVPDFNPFLAFKAFSEQPLTRTILCPQPWEMPHVSSVQPCQKVCFQSDPSQ